MSRTIVVGAGSGGGVVASRLSESKENEVVLLEAGPFFETDDALPPSLRDTYNPDLDGHGWGHLAYYIEPPEERPLAPLPQGKLVGGSSAINAAVAQRGSKEDFDEWVAAGNSEWSWDHVLPAYRRLERDLDFGGEPYHGNEGPVPIVRIPRSEWPPFARAFEEACIARGYPRCEDFNAPGSAGVGPTPRNQVGELRASTLVTYLRDAHLRPNFSLHANTFVRRVLFEGHRAIGVEVESGGHVRQLEADRIVLSAGSIKTPQLLMLSGVGPTDVLTTHSIAPVVELEGVGRNLRDHPITPIIGLVRDMSAPKYGLLAELKYASNGASTPDMLIVPALIGLTSLNFGIETDAPAAAFIGPVLAKPRSTGWVTLASSDPMAPPEIHMNYLADPEDARRLAEGTRLAYEIATTSPVRDELSEVLFPDVETVHDDEQLAAWIRQSINTAYHPSGTCRMGPDGAPGAVVDQRLAVRGCDGLYVGDGSVMPNITMALVNLTDYMIGERLAGFLAEKT